MKKTILPNLAVILFVATSGSAETRLVPREYATIQTAIDDCNDGDVVIAAPGTYTGEGNRDIDFQGKAITVRSADPNDPNIVVATIIDCNGTETGPHRGLHFHNGEDTNSVLAGVTITHGYNRDGGGIYCRNSSPVVLNCTFKHNSAVCGGGMYNRQSNPKVLNCTFIANEASSGGGIYNLFGSPRLTNCTFSGNTANWGGGIWNDDSSSTLTNCSFTSNRTYYSGAGIFSRRADLTLIDCMFSGNWADGVGGGIANGSNATLTNCIFSGNSGSFGGGIRNGANLTLTGCVFSRNAAQEEGGGIYDYLGSMAVTDCAFSGNSAEYGGAMFNKRSQATVTKCIFKSNWGHRRGGGISSSGRLRLTNCRFNGNSTGLRGGAVYTSHGSSKVTNCTFSGNVADESGGGIYSYIWSSPTITNCILWANVSPDGPQMHLRDDNNGRVSYCDVQGGWPGDGNIDVDPRFTEPGYWDPNGTPENPHDDFWVDGDYHLKSQAGRWESNPSVAGWVQEDVTSPCIDAGDINSPVGLEPFPNGGRINIGAYGGTAEASRSHFGEPICQTIVAGDINGDCTVNFADLAIMAVHWLQDNTPSPLPPSITPE